MAGLEYTLPTVHNNGTSRSDLVESRAEAVAAIYEAIEKLNLVAPNGRDYYIEKDGTARLAAAVLKHRNRLAVLKSLRKELEEEAIAINEQ